MDGANDSSATSRQELQQADALETGRAVQTGSRFVEEHNRWVVYQLEGNRETLLLSTGEISRQGGTVLIQAKSVKDFLDLENRRKK